MNSHQDIIDALKKAHKPLIITHENADGDAVGSALALFLFFTRLGRKPTVVIDNAIPEAFSFLPGADKANFESFFPRDLIIKLDCREGEVDSLKWLRDPDNNCVSIIVTPKSGHFDPAQVSFSETGARFDSIFIVDVAVLSRIAKMHKKNQALFDELPTVNIDHHDDNPLFGKINLVEPEKSSATEILSDLFFEYEKSEGVKVVDADIATCLLAGIITDTGSFQFENTKPATLQASADLIKRGARRDEIVRNIYHTRHLTTLRLWGRVLSKMQLDIDNKLAWSTITKEDLEWSGATIEERKGVINDLMTHVAEANMILLFTDDGEGVRVSIRTKNGNRRAQDLAAKFGGGGHLTASGVYLPGRDLESAVQEMIVQAREIQQEMLAGRAQEIQPQEPTKVEAAPVTQEVPQPESAAPESEGEDAVTARLKQLQK